MGTVDDALTELPPAERDALRRVIEIARRVAPDAEEGMSYGMPALTVDGRPYLAVVSTATHLSLFPFSPAVIDEVRDQLEGFSLSKGTIRFSAENPIPDAVVERLARARLTEIRG